MAVPARIYASRKLLELVTGRFQTLPFARRWLHSAGLLDSEVSIGLSDLLHNGIIHPYPVLSERPGTFVSQAETTVVVEKNGARPFL